MNHLIITAKLRNGFVTADPWSPSIDSILSYFHLKNKIGWTEFSSSMSVGEQTTVDDLPINKIVRDGFWWWDCSIPIYQASNVFVRSYYKRFNIDTISLLENKVKTIELTKNQFKNYSNTFRHIISGEVSWHVVGDKKKIGGLLTGCIQIGGKRGKGMGEIISWEIEEVSKCESSNRWVPISSSDIEAYDDVMYRAFRPSFRLKCNQSICGLNR